MSNCCGRCGHGTADHLPWPPESAACELCRCPRFVVAPTVDVDRSDAATGLVAAG